ncbi:hypothetical protein, partial [uncultured Porphyromonas sp.]|uniref:hypothetical protein n=1 Tax=uncultured Porphyromonas sp. TaxID=159274 RepID=UPI002610CE02
EHVICNLGVVGSNPTRGSDECHPFTQWMALVVYVTHACFSEVDDGVLILSVGWGRLRMIYEIYGNIGDIYRVM